MEGKKMGARVANYREHQLGEEIKKTFINYKSRVQPFQARAIADAAMEENGGEPIKIDFDMSQKTRTLGHIQYRIGWITLYEEGQTVGTLMHELAHQLPDGSDHGPDWRANFRRLSEWWNNNHQRFPYNLGIPSVRVRSQFALEY